MWLFRHVNVMSYKCSVMSTEVAPYYTSNQLWWTAERTGLFVFALPWPFKDNVKVMVRRKNKTLCTRTRREGGFDLIIRTRKKLFVRCPRLRWHMLCPDKQSETENSVQKLGFSLLMSCQISRFRITSWNTIKVDPAGDLGGLDKRQG